MDHPHLAWVEMFSQNNDGQRILESGGGAGRSGSGGENPEQQRHREEERNPDMDPSIREMKRFTEFFCKTNRDYITCPKGEEVREVCIKLHSKGNCIRD